MRPFQPTPDPNSPARRAHPLQFFDEVLGFLFLDNTKEERLALWRRQVEGSAYNAYAADTLHALEVVLADPPADLVERLEARGGVGLYHQPDERTLVPYTLDEAVAWLRRQVDEMRAVYEAQGGGARSA